MKTARLVIRKGVVHVGIHDYLDIYLWYLDMFDRQSDTENDSISGFLKIFSTQQARIGL